MNDALLTPPSPGPLSGLASAAAPDALDAPTAPASPRKRLKPGERRDQILQTLVAMLEDPRCERITIATLAQRLQISEGALYRHFKAKAEMFNELMAFIEETLQSLTQRIARQELGDSPDAPLPGPADSVERARRIVAVVLKFGERNPGLVRLLLGDRVLLEDEAQCARMAQCMDRIEATLRQCLRPAARAGEDGSPALIADASATAALLIAFIQGRLLTFTRTTPPRLPTENLDACLAAVI